MGGRGEEVVEDAVLLEGRRVELMVSMAKWWSAVVAN